MFQGIPFVPPAGNAREHRPQELGFLIHREIRDGIHEATCSSGFTRNAGAATPRSASSIWSTVRPGRFSWAILTSALVGWASAGTHRSGCQALARISDFGQCG
ncbi:hypothetical protein SALBM135S_04819 [Streptomyces alboniger]